MLEKSISKLHLEHYLHDEVLYYSVVVFNNKLYYLCICSHFFYLFHESFAIDPFQFRFEQVRHITVDASYASLFTISLMNKNQQKKDLLLEASDSARVIQELKVHWKTNFVLKNWSLSHNNNSTTADKQQQHANSDVELNVFSSDLPYTRKNEKPTLDTLRKRIKDSSVAVTELFGNYVMLAQTTWKQQDVAEQNSKTHLSKRGLYETSFIDSKTNIKVKIHMMRARNWNNNKISLRNVVEKVAFVSHTDIVKNGALQKQKPSYHDLDDKSVWDAHEVILKSLEANGNVNVVIGLRRLFIPPTGEEYQDFLFDFVVPHALAQKSDDYLPQIHAMIHSLCPIPQCFLYDILFLRAKLESLTCDDDMYMWLSRFFKLKPELLPLKLEKAPEPVSRQDQFVQAIANAMQWKDVQVSKHASDKPFTVEEGIFTNIDSPDTVKNPSNVHMYQFRGKLARYLAYYADGIASDNISIKKLVDLLATTTDTKLQDSIRQLLEYFLHIRVFDGPYQSQKSLYDKIDEVEQKAKSLLKFIYYGDAENADDDDDDFDIDVDQRHKDELLLTKKVCSLNVQVFLKLLRLKYFQLPCVNLPTLSFVQLYTYVLRLCDNTDMILSLCITLSKLMISIKSLKKDLCSYPPFLHALSAILFVHDDAALQMTIVKIFSTMCAESPNVKEWLVSGEYFASFVQYMKLGRFKVPVNNALCILFKVIAQTETLRTLVAEKALAQLIAFTNIPVSETPKALPKETLKLLENACGCLWVVAADEDVTRQAISLHIVDTLTNILTSCSNVHQELAQNMFGVFMMLSSYGAYRYFVETEAVIKQVINHIQTVLASFTNKPAPAKADNLVSDSDSKPTADKQEADVKFLRTAFGVLFILSDSKSAQMKMNDNMLALLTQQVLADPVLSIDRTISVVVKKISERLTAQ